jgi:Raf kinase inhibitor-like YbhB/YbcL family protein
MIQLLLTLAASAAFAGGTFKVTSKDVQNGKTLKMEQVFNGMGCTGKNESPQLEWTGAPKDTKSFAITVYDPDAPTGSGWWHWTVANIPANVTSLEAGASGTGMPAGSVEGRTDFGKPGFGGACPPPKDKPHHYVITVYALKTDKLDLTSDAGGAMFGYYLNANKLAKASMTATYSR